MSNPEADVVAQKDAMIDKLTAQKATSDMRVTQLQEEIASLRAKNDDARQQLMSVLRLLQSM